jgi:hypothetical protein
LYCDLAKALGIVYTIVFTKHKPEDIEIRVYYDPTTRYTYNLVLINQGKYVINFTDAEIVNIESLDKKLKQKFKYSSTDLKINNY